MSTPQDMRSIPRTIPSSSSNAIFIWLVISWLWVGVPLAWGVTQTVIKSKALFVTPAAAAPAAPPAAPAVAADKVAPTADKHDKPADDAVQSAKDVPAAKADDAPKVEK